MKIRLLLLFLLLHGATPGAAEFDPRAHSDLGPVITLCATEPESPRFDVAWTDWVRDNPTADVDAAIRTVLSRAGTLRSMAVPGMTPGRVSPRPDPRAVAERMRYLARKTRYREDSSRN